MIRKMQVLLLLALGFAAFQAQPVSAQQNVECRSEGYQYRACPVPWGRSVMVQQLSSTQCREGQNWGDGQGYVWVHQGCAARFTAAHGSGGGPLPGRGQIACNSERNRYNECRTNWRDAQLVQQTSNAQCVEGRTWGFRNGLLWVDQGCAGIFAESRGSWGGGGGAGSQVECNSERNRYRECPVGNWPSAQLIRQTSNAQCIQGRTWGYGGGVLWVDQGCAGVFESTRSSWRPPAGSGQITCNSQGNRYRECPASGWRDAQLVRQTSRASCIEGQTWGLRRGVLWVDKGCAGTFTRSR